MPLPSRPLSASSGGRTGLASVVIKHDSNAPAPTRWVPVGKVERLFIYPLKSARGVELKRAVADRHGLFSPTQRVRDRQFLVVDGGGRFVTARQHPRMVLIKAEVADADELRKRKRRRGQRGATARWRSAGAPGGPTGVGGDVLLLSAPGMGEDALEVPLPGRTRRDPRVGGDDDEDRRDSVEQQHDANVQIWLDRCSGRDLGDEASRWVSKYLRGREDAGLRLIFHLGVDSSRPEYSDNFRHSFMPFARGNDLPLYADNLGYLLFSRETLNDVNERLRRGGVKDLTLEERRFRPNIFISGVSGPYAEDAWRFIHIGGVVSEEDADNSSGQLVRLSSGGASFRNVKLCKRCVFTTIDPDSGQRDRRGEPLKTLRKYRCTLDRAERRHFGMAPVFGISLAADKVGEIRVGDTVYAGVE